MATTAEVPATTCGKPADVRRETLELIRRVETVIAASEAARQQAQDLCLVAQSTHFPRFTIPVWNEAGGVLEDLKDQEIDEGVLATVREFLILVELASRDDDA
jgi:hypothetical protein